MKMRIKTQAGHLIPLRELASYQIERGEVGIKHFQGEREIRVEASLTDEYASTTTINSEIKKNIVPKLEANFPAVGVEFRGQAESAKKSSTSMIVITSILILLMLLVLSLNFNSLWQGLLFFPIIFIGSFCAMLGHGIEHKPFSLLSIWGVIALMGILVNDAVVFLDKYNRNLSAGENIVDAAFNAGISRFRAIVLTSITTIAGLYPLILEESFQAQFLIPMSISVAYGVLFGTVFILLFFPLLILFFNDARRALRWLWTGVKPLPEEVEPRLMDMKLNKEIDADLA